MTLTYGKYYYFPCNNNCINHEGVIDDEEFTSYMSYSLDKSDFRILQDN